MTKPSLLMSESEVIEYSFKYFNSGLANVTTRIERTLTGVRVKYFAEPPGGWGPTTEELVFDSNGGIVSERHCSYFITGKSQAKYLREDLPEFAEIFKRVFKRQPSWPENIREQAQKLAPTLDALVTALKES